MVFKLLLDPKGDQGRESLFTPTGKLKIKNDPKVPLIRQAKQQKRDKQAERKEKSSRRQKVRHRNGDRHTSKRVNRQSERLITK